MPSYYAVIDELSKIGGPKYLRVPIDEEPFEIDTNTHTVHECVEQIKAKLKEMSWNLSL